MYFLKLNQITAFQWFPYLLVQKLKACRGWQLLYNLGPGCLSQHGARDSLPFTHRLSHLLSEMPSTCLPRGLDIVLPFWDFPLLSTTLVLSSRVTFSGRSSSAPAFAVATSPPTPTLCTRVHTCTHMHTRTRACTHTLWYCLYLPALCFPITLVFVSCGCRNKVPQTK